MTGTLDAVAERVFDIVQFDSTFADDGYVILSQQAFGGIGSPDRFAPSDFVGLGCTLMHPSGLVEGDHAMMWASVWYP